MSEKVRALGSVCAHREWSPSDKRPISPARQENRTVGDVRVSRRLKGSPRAACEDVAMPPGRATRRTSQCVLCISCASFLPGARGEGAGTCLAAADPQRALFECESYVRKLGRAPDVPARYRDRPA
jgi:hypothetical protein